LALPWQQLYDKGFFQNFEFPSVLIKNRYFFEVNFTFFAHFRVNLLVLITSGSILAVFEGFWKI